MHKSKFADKFIEIKLQKEIKKIDFGVIMDIATDNQWKHDANSGNFAMDNDYEKAFESYISDVEDDDEGEFLKYCLLMRKLR